MISDIQQLLNAWSIDIYYGWSIMDGLRLGFVLTTVIMVYNYFFDTVKR